MKAKELVLLSSFYISNHSTSIFHIVLATDLENSKLAGDEHEHVVAMKTSFKEATEKLLKQQVPTAQVVIAMNLAKDYLAKNL